MRASFFLSLLSAVLVAANSMSHGILLARDGPLKPYRLSLETREMMDDFLLEVQKRGLHLSKSSESALRRSFDQKQIATSPKQEHATGDTSKRRPGHMIPTPNIKNAGRKSLSQPTDSGKISLHPKASQPSGSASASAYKRPAGGGFIGHSRIPPKVPEASSGRGAMQIPAPLWEDKRKQSPPIKKPPQKKVDSKTEQSQAGDRRHTGSTRREGPEQAFDPFEGMPPLRHRPPALTSMDEF